MSASKIAVVPHILGMKISVQRAFFMIYNKARKWHPTIPTCLLTCWVVYIVYVPCVDETIIEFLLQNDLLILIRLAFTATKLWCQQWVWKHNTQHRLCEFEIYFGFTITCMLLFAYHAAFETPSWSSWGISIYIVCYTVVFLSTTCSCFWLNELCHYFTHLSAQS